MQQKGCRIKNDLPFDVYMKFHKYFSFTPAFLIAGLLLFVPANMKGYGAKSVSTQKNTKDLQISSNNTDSIKALLDIYSMSGKEQRDRIRMQLINLTHRSDNNELIKDVLKELSTTTDDTHELGKLLEISESLPEGEGRETLQTVLHMEQAQSEAEGVSDSQVRSQIIENTRLAMTLDSDPYKEIQNLYRAMVYLGSSSQGPLYLEYIKRMDDLVNSLPENNHTIRSLFYTTAAIFYTRKRDYAQAIEYDRKLLKQLDVIKSRTANRNDASNDIDYFYYLSYRRMLRNFMGLTPEEIEDLYNKCLQLAQEDEKVRESMGNLGLVNSYYYVATKQFSKAVPALRQSLNDSTISDFRRQELLGLLAWSLNETGDKNNELLVLREYTKMMQNDMDKRREGTYREIELRNSVNKIINDEYIARENQREENKVMRKTSLTLVYVLAVALIFLFQAYMRLRQKVKMLELRNTKLRTNIEHIFDDGKPKGTRDLHHRSLGLKG